MTLAFGLMTLLLSAVLVSAVWLLTSAYVNAQHEQAAEAQASDHALVLEGRLGAGADAASLVEGLRYPPDGSALLVFDGRDYTSTTSGQVSIPTSFTDQVTSGSKGHIRVLVEGRNYLAVGIPLGGKNAFIELFPRTDLEGTLRILFVILLVSGAVTTTLGFLFARILSRRVLQPVAEVTAAAAAIAKGDLSARLDPLADPDLAELATSFNRTAVALERRVHADARFAGDVSHELRTPLTTMLTSMESLQNRGRDLPPSLREPLDMLAHELGRFGQLVVDLLEISRSDDDVASREPVEIAELVRRAADGAAGRAVTVIDPGASGVVVSADKRRLAQVVTNLVTNAESHGGGCTAVHVAVASEWIRISVEDEGPGVPEQSRERIFERFTREPGVEPSGFGLGLAIAARHVQLHGGRLRVEPNSGRGARFVINLASRAGPRSDTRSS